MYLKRMIVLVVMFLLLLSIFSIAEVADTSTDTENRPISESQTVSEAKVCGFWCRVNTFLFGSAENRAGKGWFDRKEALVGMAGKIKTTCALTPINDYCSSNGKIYQRISINYWKNVEVSPTTLDFKPKGDSFFSDDASPGTVNLGSSSITVQSYAESLKYVISMKADYAVQANQAVADAKIQAEDSASTQTDKVEAVNVANVNADEASATVVEIEKLLNELNELPVVDSIKKSAGELLLKAKFAEKEAAEQAEKASASVYPPSTEEPAPTASTPSPAEEPAAAGTPAPKAESTFIFNPVISEDGTLTVQGPEVLHKYTPVSEAKLGDKPVYQYSADNVPQSEWYVAEGDGFVRVIQVGSNWKYLKNDETITTIVSEAKKSTLIGDEVTITAGADGKIITSTAKPAATEKGDKKATSQPSAAPAPPPPSKPAPTYTEVFSDSLDGTNLGKQIQAKYFEKGNLKPEYEFITGTGEIKTKATTKTKDTEATKAETALTYTKKDDGMVVVIDYDKDKDKGTVLPEETHYLFLSGKEIAKQTDAQMKDGKATIYEGEESHTVFMKDSDTYVDSLDFSEQQLFYEDEEDKSNGVVKSALQVGDGKITYTDAGEETQTITDTKNNEITELGGDWDSDDKDFTPSDGTIYEIDKKTGEKGKAKYLADYDYKDKKLDTVELFDPITGDYLGDDTNPADGFTPPSVKPAQITKTVLSSIYAAATSVKDYPAISKVLGISDWWKGVIGDDLGWDYMANADQNFAPMLGTNWFPSWICENHYDLEPEGTAMIKTPSGTYQAVAHIEGERSAQKSPILCNRNPDQEAEQEWLCDDYQVCLDNSFCYEDKDLNSKPDDEEKQLSGYFYKITWGVSAPSDETFTPFIDENGVAVTFNVVIKNTNKAEPLYSKEGDIEGPIELKNGDSDQDIILHYSPNLFTEVCIEWEHAPATTDTPGWEEGFTFGLSQLGSGGLTHAIEDPCFDLVTSSVGEVNWEAGGKPSSTKASDPEVSLSTGW